MRQILIAATILLPAVTLDAVPLRAEIIAEDEGLYEQERWNVGKRYDDLGNPSDAPGIITEGRDPAYPSGPAIDTEGDVESSGSIGEETIGEEEESIVEEED